MMTLGVGYTCLDVGRKRCNRKVVLYCNVMREGSLVRLDGTGRRDLRYLRGDLTYFRLGPCWGAGEDFPETFLKKGPQIIIIHIRPWLR